jgi:alpha-ribazole phosphatase
MPKRLLLVRHARVKHEFVGRLIGASDVPLDPSSDAQLEALAERLAQWSPKVCYCSPMLRCRETAKRIAPHLPPQLDADLREIDFGRWENRRYSEIAAEDPALIDSWAAFAPDFAFPEGESVKSFLGRVHHIADRIAEQIEQTAVLVAHGGVIRAMLCHYLGLEPRKYVAFDISYAGLAAIDLYDGGGILIALERGDAPERKDG